MTRWLAVVCLVLLPMRAGAEWHFKPFVGVTFGVGTSFVDVDHATNRANFVFGVNGALLGEVFGVEGDLSRAPGFFQAGQGLVLGSSVTTLTGNVIVAMPKRIFQYTLRPYFVGGTGIIRAQTTTSVSALNVMSTLPALDFGGGATGFINDRVGVNWELRHFRSFKGKQLTGASFSEEQLSFWRATMAVAFRY